MSEREAQEREDGFRARRKRPRGWYAQAIRDGVIADPSSPAPEPVYDADTRVITVPVATLQSHGEGE